MANTRHVVKAPGGKQPGVIELRLNDLNQLFDSFDPAPFHEKDLDHDAEEYIVSWAQEYPRCTEFVFVLHLPASQQALEPEHTVHQAVTNYFAYRTELKRHELRRLIRQGRASLLVGLLFLAVCNGARELLRTISDEGWMLFVEEGLLIVGWVAMWRPLEILLYDWWPILRARRTYACLARMAVEVRYSG
jgi:hypothetical protein